MTNSRLATSCFVIYPRVRAVLNFSSRETYRCTRSSSRLSSLRQQSRCIGAGVLYIYISICMFMYIHIGIRCGDRVGGKRRGRASRLRITRQASSLATIYGKTGSSYCLSMRHGCQLADSDIELTDHCCCYRSSFRSSSEAARDVSFLSASVHGCALFYPCVLYLYL